VDFILQLLQASDCVRVCPIPPGEFPSSKHSISLIAILRSNSNLVPKQSDLRLLAMNKDAPGLGAEAAGNVAEVAGDVTRVIAPLHYCRVEHDSLLLRSALR
jgi:hypothetical protein